ncbi:hypothetical protein, partial [Bacillus subtilis]|uniref:hypothetical protein n=1 Tax=Bacillus subtilis TaxID=1423 RepID=UPI00301B97FC
MGNQVPYLKSGLVKEECYNAFWGQMGTNWGPTSSFLIKKEYFQSETYVRKPYKIGFENKTSVRIRNTSPHWQRRGQGFEPPWLHT